MLNESYRKAGRLDVGSFSPTLQILSLHQILQKVRSGLTEGTEGDAERPVVAELHKLDV